MCAALRCCVLIVCSSPSIEQKWFMPQKFEIKFITLLVKWTSNVLFVCYQSSSFPFSAPFNSDLAKKSDLAKEPILQRSALGFTLESIFISRVTEILNLTGDQHRFTESQCWSHDAPFAVKSWRVGAILTREVYQLKRLRIVCGRTKGDIKRLA